MEIPYGISRKFGNSFIFRDFHLFSVIFSHFQRFYVNLPENQQKWLYSGNLTHPPNIIGNSLFLANFLKYF